MLFLMQSIFISSGKKYGGKSDLWKSSTNMLRRKKKCLGKTDLYKSNVCFSVYFRGAKERYGWKKIRIKIHQFFWSLPTPQSKSCKKKNNAKKIKQNRSGFDCWLVSSSVHENSCEKIWFLFHSVLLLEKEKLWRKIWHMKRNIFLLQSILTSERGKKIEANIQVK